MQSTQHSSNNPTPNSNAKYITHEVHGSFREQNYHLCPIATERERISSGSEMHTFSFQTATFTYVFAMSGSSNIKVKNACASGGPLGANQCLPVEIYCLKIPKTVVMMADFGIDNKD